MTRQLMTEFFACFPLFFLLLLLLVCQCTNEAILFGLRGKVNGDKMVTCQVIEGFRTLIEPECLI